MKVKLILAVDLGSSLIKVFYWLIFEDGRVLEGLLTFCSAVLLISASHYEARRYVDDNTCVLSFDGDYWMVGDAAIEESTTNARVPKLQDGAAKVLAVLGQVLSQRPDDLATGEIQLELGVLLPLDEMRSDQQLIERLRILLCREGFGHNGKRIKCDLVKGIHVSPEGYGASRILKRSPSTVFASGFRDGACLYVNNGSISIPKSLPLAGWGMIKLIEMVSFTFKDKLAAAKAIFKAGETFKEKPLLEVVPPESLAYVQSELQAARSLMWAQMWHKLAYSTIQSAEQVLVVGGTGVYWRPELKKAVGLRLSMGGEIVKDIQKRFPHLTDLSLLYRCSDCYMFWLTLLEASDLKPRSTELSVVVGGRKSA